MRGNASSTNVNLHLYASDGNSIRLDLVHGNGSPYSERGKDATPALKSSLRLSLMMRPSCAIRDHSTLR